jgi:hypothetical protein
MQVDPGLASKRINIAAHKRRDAEWMRDRSGSYQCAVRCFKARTRGCDGVFKASGAVRQLVRPVPIDAVQCALCAVARLVGRLTSFVIEPLPISADQCGVPAREGALVVAAALRALAPAPMAAVQSGEEACASAAEPSSKPATNSERIVLMTVSPFALNLARNISSAGARPLSSS